LLCDNLENILASSTTILVRGHIVKSFIQWVATRGACSIAALAGVVWAQTPQLIITEPAAIAGRYAAITFDREPGVANSFNATSLGTLFVYDFVDCEKKTISKPVAGTALGKTALIVDNERACKIDELVRLAQADGATAVLISVPFSSIPRSISHSDPTGISIPTLLLGNGTIASAMRDAVVSGASVKASYLTVPYLRGNYAAIPMLPGQIRAAAVGMTPSVTASVNFGSVDLFRNDPGIQNSGKFLSPCPETTYAYSLQDKAILVGVPGTATFTGRCAITYLIADSLKYEVASQVEIMVGVPVAVIDFAWTLPDTAVAVDVLANDIGDPSVKDPARIDLLVDTEAIEQNVVSGQGSWVVKEGKVLFTPRSGFSGLATLRYRVGGKNGRFSNEQTIRVNVTTSPAPYTGPTKIAREFYLPSRDIYFRTANDAEANFVASGGAGPWIDTANLIPVGGSDQICRFYGNSKINPANNAPYGPQSHFYTIDKGECESLNASYAASAKSWSFESLDFAAVPLKADKTCPAETVPVYRMYNNGFPAKDSNHRYALSPDDFRALLPLGWQSEGAVFCVPFLF
jgi:hypothetical protein